MTKVAVKGFAILGFFNLEITKIVKRYRNEWDGCSPLISGSLI